MQQLQGVYNLQEPHFWTLCTDVYIGTLKLLIAPDADGKWILSQTHNIFTQVGMEAIPLYHAILLQVHIRISQQQIGNHKITGNI